MADGLVVTNSARKHGVKDGDIEHAYDHPIHIYELDEGFTMFIGPNRAGLLIEVGVVQGDTGDVAVHAMRARDKFLR
jgi:hypothetical protein